MLICCDYLQAAIIWSTRGTPFVKGIWARIEIPGITSRSLAEGRPTHWRRNLIFTIPVSGMWWNAPSVSWNRGGTFCGKCHYIRENDKPRLLLLALHCIIICWTLEMTVLQDRPGRENRTMRCPNGWQLMLHLIWAVSEIGLLRASRWCRRGMCVCKSCCNLYVRICNMLCVRS